MIKHVIPNKWPPSSFSSSSVSHQHPVPRPPFSLNALEEHKLKSRSQIGYTKSTVEVGLRIGTDLSQVHILIMPDIVDIQERAIVETKS
jgi:hypothetical protein